MRASGVLLHITSLPSKYGIGTMGREAYRFVDFLVKAGQTYWQILPIGPTSYGDSPYQSSSTFAGNPYFIDLEELVTEGLLDPFELDEAAFGNDPEKVDFGKIYENRWPLLRKAAGRFLVRVGGWEDAPLRRAYESFCAENAYWLDSFALFSALKERFGGVSWQDWPDAYKDSGSPEVKALADELFTETETVKALQFLFFRDWRRLKDYANENGIRIIGDIPIYVALDSADVWADPEDFQLDRKTFAPADVAGVPPDAFTDDGQLWGNPLYDWKRMKENGYDWWLKRVAFATAVYDVVRIDHFRGFEAYWSVPAGETTARNGRWIKGPDYDLFRTIKEKLGDLPIIAEDLGVLTPGVYRLMKRVGFPGMKIMEFAFSPDPSFESEYLPYRIPKNSIAYIGTHDNETALGWLANTDPESRAFAIEYMHLTEEEGYHWGFIRTLLGCPANTVIVQMQDLIALGNEARMNFPSTLENNWTWRVRSECINDWLAEILRRKTEVYKRLNPRLLAEQKSEEK